MTQLQATRQHRVFHVSYKGDTLVVVPRGDAAGFSPLEFRIEFNRIQRILEETDLTNLVIDFGNARYFGPTVMDAMVELGNRVVRDGGQTVFCSVSDDMLTGLKIRHVDEGWPVYETRQAALRAIARESWKQKLYANAGIAATAAVLLVGGLIYQYYPFTNPDVAHYETVVRIWDRYHELHQRNSSPDEFDSFRAAALQDLEGLVSRLEQTTTPDDFARKALLWASRDHLMPTLMRDHRLAPEDAKIHSIQFEMDTARSWIEKTGQQVTEFRVHFNGTRSAS